MAMGLLFYVRITTTVNNTHTCIKYPFTHTLTHGPKHTHYYTHIILHTQYTRRYEPRDNWEAKDAPCWQQISHHVNKCHHHTVVPVTPHHQQRSSLMWDRSKKHGRQARVCILNSKARDSQTAIFAQSCPCWPCEEHQQQRRGRQTYARRCPPSCCSRSHHHHDR